MLNLISKRVKSKPLLNDHLPSYEKLDAPSFKSPFAIPKIELYDRNNLHQLNWPENEDAQFIKNYLSPFIEKGTLHFIKNVVTDLKLIKIGELIVPITINEKEYMNSHVCSPYSYFIEDARLSIDIVSNWFLKNCFKGLFSGFSTFFRLLKIDKVITVNNLILSTNLFPKLPHEYLTAINQYLIKKYPEHALIYRTINPNLDEAPYNELKNERFNLIASKQVYHTNTKEDHLFEARLYKSDLRLLEKSGYEICELEDPEPLEIERILQLYRQIYIDKYVQLNLDINFNYFYTLIKNKAMKFLAIKKEGEIDGFVGFLIRNGVMNCPFLGYDTSKPQELGLYRILCTVLMQEARKHKALFHQSAGASMYKKIRKASSSIEYTAVNYDHLKFYRKIPWIVIGALFNTFGVYYMQKY